MKQLTFLIILLSAQQLSAQNVLRLQHLNVEDGLSQSSVNSVLQDAHGFMWFATGDGLDRYDGKDFIVYKSRHNDTFSAQMKDRNINSCIFEDKNNKLWLATDAGISFLNSRNGSFGFIQNKNGAQNDAILIGIDSDKLWSAVLQTGIYATNINTLQNSFYPFTDTFQNKQGIVYPFQNGIKAANGLWVADRAGLLFFDKNTHRDERALINNKVSSVRLLQNGRLLLTVPDGFYLYDIIGKTTGFIPVKNKNGAPFLWRSFAEDVETRNIYLGSVNSGTICKISLDTRKYEFIDFQSYSINCLYIDHSQNLWVGTEGNGVFKLDIKQPKFSCYTPNTANDADDLEGLMVKSIYRDDSGKILIGTYDNGLVIYDPEKRTKRNIEFPFSTDGKHISTILKDSTGNVVITIGSAILWLDPLSYKIQKQIKLPLAIALSPEEPVIYSLVEWKKDHYLAGTNISLYAVKYENGVLSETRPYISHTNMYLTYHIYDLNKEKDGTINIGKRSGYTKIRMIQDSIAEVLDQGFDHLGIRHFYQSIATPILWIASEKGLIAYSTATKEYILFDETNGLANSFVYAILPQNDTSLWISTNHGISHVKVHYDGGINVKVQFINYTSKDGLQSNEFNTGAYYQDKDGTMFFGGIEGINWFEPNKITPNLFRAKPAIVDIYINNSLFARDSANYIQTIDLLYTQNTISFSLRALEFTKQEQNRFTYKLEGLDKDWVYNTANDVVRYSNLQPGTYTFLLKASNNEDLWNDEPLTMQIIIRPPYWQTWWFRMVIIFCFISLIYFIARIYVKQKVRSKTRELEKQQALYMERLRISKDVHDDLGSGLSKISLMAALAQKRTGNDITLGNDIKQISTVSKELVDNMRDLIWVLNPENTTLEQLVSRLREYCADYLENMPVKVILHFPDTVPVLRISREAQRNIFLTTKEAINNCIKHAEASEIKITLTLIGGIMKIDVSDNGKGFDMAHLKRSGNGLRNMKQRIELIGGRFDITSIADKTTLSISIPFEKLRIEKNTTLM